MLHLISLNAVFRLRFEKIYEEAQRVSSSRAPQLSAEHTPEDHGLLCQHQVIRKKAQFIVVRCVK